MNNEDGKFERNKYVTIAETKNVKLPINEERVRLGIMVKNEKGIEHPVETDHFVCPKVIRDVYGEEPTELTVFFPVAEREQVFPQCYEKYGGNNALQCQGDGEESAQRKNQETGKWHKIKCPCEHFNKKYDPKTKIGGCVKAGYLKFMIPSVSIGTFYQCRVGGTVSIQECNSGFYLANITTGGHWAMIPFRMKRVAKKLKIPGTANMKNHWVVTLEIAASTEEIRRVMSGEILYLGQLRSNKVYELEATIPEDRKMIEKDGAVIEEETSEETVAREANEAEQEKAEKEANKKEFEESKKKQADLKKARKIGATSLKTPAQVKKIMEKKQAKIANILTTARAYKVNSWDEIMELGIRYKIFFDGIVASQAKTYVCDHPEACDALLEVIKTDQEITNEDLGKTTQEG